MKSNLPPSYPIPEFVTKIQQHPGIWVGILKDQDCSGSFQFIPLYSKQGKIYSLTPAEGRPEFILNLDGHSFQLNLDSELREDGFFDTHNWFGPYFPNRRES